MLLDELFWALFQWNKAYFFGGYVIFFMTHILLKIIKFKDVLTGNTADVLKAYCANTHYKNILAIHNLIELVSMLFYCNREKWFTFTMS